jgi:hypothetical protein
MPDLAMGRPEAIQFVSSSNHSLCRYRAVDGGNVRRLWPAAVETWVVMEGDGSAKSGVA